MHHNVGKRMQALWQVLLAGRCNQTSYFIKTFSYTDRLVHLGLPTLKYRRLRGDMIEVLKIIKHIYDYKVAPELIFNINKVIEEMILDCLKTEVTMILESSRSLIE